MHKPNMSLVKTPVPTQDMAVRMANFNEVELGYSKEQAMAEAARCLNCPGRYCAASCPINTPVPEFIKLIRDGDLSGAYKVISDANPMASFSCRVCAQERQCEKNCTRGIKGEPTAIGRLERFVTDWHRLNKMDISKEAEKPERNGKCVAVIGSGPAGLACAERLAQAGYAVDIYESRPYAGGIPAYGIPNFVLPEDILAEYLEYLTDLGVAIHLNKTVNGDFSVKYLLEHGSDAVFVAAGAGRPVRLEIEGETLPNVYSAEDYLLAAKRNPDLLRQADHRTVIVVGGGNTAIDVCRNAKRFGAEKVYLLYRRTRKEMPARQTEIRYAEEEGIEFCFLTQPVRMIGETQVTGVGCIRMELCDPDYPCGRANVRPLLNQEFILEADALVTALGHEPIPMEGLPVDAAGYVKVNKDGISTSLDGVFAGGDITGGEATLIGAVAAGKKAAQAIDKYLNK